MSENEKNSKGNNLYIPVIIGVTVAVLALSYGMFSLAQRDRNQTNDRADYSAQGQADQELLTLAEQYQISVGKASLIREAIAQNPGLTVEVLVPMTLQELSQMISDKAAAEASSEIANSGNGAEISSKMPNAGNGVGISSEMSNQESASGSPAGTQNPNNNTNAPTGTQYLENGAGEPSYIGEKAAKEAALADAGLKESSVAYLFCYVDYDDGRAEHYNVDFATANTEYEYEIDLYSGRVLDKGIEAILVNPQKENGASPGGEPYIGEEAAWSAALNHVGLAETEVQNKKVQLDMEDGIMVYEIEFEKGRIEYDYEIHATSGEILKAEKDSD